MFALRKPRQNAETHPASHTGSLQAAERSEEETQPEKQAVQRQEQAWIALADYFGDDRFDLTRPLTILSQDPVVCTAVNRLARFLDEVRSLRRQQEDLTLGAAAGAASTGHNMHLVAQHMGEAKEQVEQANVSICQCQDGVAEVAKAASSAAAAGQQVTEAIAQGGHVIQGAIDSLGQIQQEIAAAQAQIEVLANRSEEISRVSGVIGSVAQRTNLLALNAAIEAARAGQHGRGFSVVADEVRKLAEHTASQTQEIRSLVAEIAAALKQTQAAIRDGRQKADEGVELAAEASRSLTQIQTLVRTASEPLEQIAALAEEQSAALEQVAGSQQMITDTVGGVTAKAAEMAVTTSKLAGMTEEAYHGMSRFICGSYADRLAQRLRQAASETAGVLESVVDRGEVTLEDLLALDYVEYKGQNVDRLRRFWGDLSRVPRGGFHPPRYGTAYDHLVDVELRQILDAMVADIPTLIFAVVLDLNGYNPAQNSHYAMPVYTGDEKSAFASRVKRLRPDESQVRGSRMGLNFTDSEPLGWSQGGLERNPKTVHRRQEFLRAGVDLREPAGGDRGLLLQTSFRQTGVFNVLSVPLYVKGQRYGAIMAGWKPETT